MLLNREEFLAQLESISPGLSASETTEQSSCVVFRKGWMMSFNEEVACKRKTPLRLTAAVQAAPLLKLLQQMTETDIDVSLGEGAKKGVLLIKGQRRQSGIRMEAEVTLPIGEVEKPGEWQSLPNKFLDAVQMVQRCAAKSESTAFALTCVHLHPKWVEATDTIQVARYRIRTGLSEACLVRREAIKHITSLGMTHVSETAGWLHFKNPDGLRLSLRRYLEKFQNLSPFLKTSGTPTTLPKGLADATTKAEIFSAENADQNEVTVTLLPGKLRVRGEGACGWYKEHKTIKYDGPTITFSMSPSLLADITRRYHDCEIAEGRMLKVQGGRYTYVTSLEATTTTTKKERDDDESE